MSQVAVITDSTAYLPHDLIKQYNITITPLSIIWGENTYQDGVDIQPDEFYKRLADSKVLPTTSQVTLHSMKTAFDGLLEKGFDVLGIFISSKFSGTVQSAIQACELIPHAKDRIQIVDSFSTTMAMGWPVLMAARAALAGESLDACRKVAENSRDNSGVLFVVETLEFLHRGGRIGGAQALFGTLLNIKPVLELRDGRIESVEKVRTKARALDRILELAVDRIAGRKPVRLATVHANAETEASILLETADAALNPIETYCCPLSPVVGNHAGPGTVALTYMAGIP
jgi:DegV family protein with EDD domain